MAFTFPGSAIVNISGQVALSTDGPYTQVSFFTAGLTRTNAVPAGKRWRVVSACATNAGTTDGYIHIVDGANGGIGKIISLDSTVGLNYSTAVGGNCIAIIPATYKIEYSGSGNIVYVEENA